ncbi:MAG: phosphate acyltransferase, partial [Pseudomonadota bacterium]
DHPPAGLGDVIAGADLFLGLSGPNLLKPEMVKAMAPQPIVLALANPNPEIMPDVAREAVPDAIVATGRSDYPNQVNNVLCFPFIFRGALDVGATTINDAMKIACVEAIAALARQTSSAETAQVYGGEALVFGPDYLIPKPFDNRLLGIVAGAVAKAAMETGVATRPLPDFAAYCASLNRSVYRSANVMRPVFEAAARATRRIAFAEGEDERVLRAAMAMIEESADRPILIGRPQVIASRAERLGIPASIAASFDIVNPENDPRYRDYWETYHAAMARRGVTPQLAQAVIRTNTTAIGAVMVHRGEADSLICGTFGQYGWHLRYIEQMLASDRHRPDGALSLVILDRGPLFIADTHVHAEPSAVEIAQTVISTATHVRRFGLEPRVALCSNSQFGELDTPSAARMREAIAILDAEPRDFSYEGEMTLDAALDPEYRERVFPGSRLEGPAKALVFSSAETASAVRNTLKAVSGGVEVGPILMGLGNQAHIVTPSITVRGLINIAALAGAPLG